MSRHDKTMACLRNPRTGYRFHEMYSAWLGVVWVGDGVLAAHWWGPARENLTYEYSTSPEEFARRHAYKTMPDKSPWDYCDEMGPVVSDAQAHAIIADLSITPEERQWAAVAAGL